MVSSKIFKFPLKYTLIVLGIFLLAGCGNNSSDVEKCLENGSCVAALDVVKTSNELSLDPNAPFWSSPDGPKKIKLELGPQMFTNPKWPNPSIKEVTVSAVRNKSELAILLEWEDNAKDNSFGFSERFTDQAAVMFPLEPQEQAPMITMGNDGRTVNIWQWKASWQKDLDPKKDSQSRRRQDSSSISGPVSDRFSPVEDLNAEGFSTLTIQEEQNVQGKGVWWDNRWRVIFRRPLTNSDTADAQFGGSTQMAVAIWNGGNKERNGQKGLIGWVLLRFP
jgi:Ethylbenzene dehydrogenase